MEAELLKMVITGSPGAAALCVVLLIVIRELPAMRAQHDKHHEALVEANRQNNLAQQQISDKFVAALTEQRHEFRKELAAERAICAQQREFDREARQELARLLALSNPPRQQPDDKKHEG